MAAGSTKRRTRQRGGIDELPSGALRVRVYAGMDPISKRRMYLSEVVPPGPRASDPAERVRTRLLSQVEEQRSPPRGETGRSAARPVAAGVIAMMTIVFDILATDSDRLDFGGTPARPAS